MNELKRFLSTRFGAEIREKKTIESRKGELVGLPGGLAKGLVESLAQMGVRDLYSHQGEAFEKISSNQDTLLVSKTASGKTLSFFLPILDQYAKANSPFSVLLLYPTKALSRDQESVFGKLIRSVAQPKILGTFDGDTSQDERARIQRSADFVITNPDMLHNGILPNHNRKWRDFLSRLRYVVVDEVHIYRGAFGSQVANVFRRLVRVANIHGSRPVFVCSSATIGNPGEHARALFRRDFQLIDKDGAPQKGREIFFMNPPLVTGPGGGLYRKGPASIAIPLIREAAEKKIRTICFCRSRQEVERLVRAATDGRPGLRSVVKPYRGGLLPSERRKLERDLAEGKILVVVTTNALELGIDIGDLKLCILNGHPGTVASFWQQSGRVGRKSSDSVVVYLAKDNPIDQYLVNHPEFATDAPIERAWLNADNPYILLQHLPCAAHEHPLNDEEPEFDTEIYPEALEILKENKSLAPYRGGYRCALKDFPSRGVNLRGMTDYNVEIYHGTEVIGEIDPIGARGTLYKDAIYQHLGTRYMSLDLDLEKKLCRVEKVEVDYYTEAVWEGRVEMSECFEERRDRQAVIRFGFVHYNKQPKLYKKIRERSYENIGYGPITLEPFEYDTTGMSLLPPRNWSDLMESKDKRYIGAALFGLSYLLKRVAPGLCMGDMNDIATDVGLSEVGPSQFQSALYLFDRIEGGVGYAEKIFESLEDCWRLAMRILDECECEGGCPSCVPSLPPGIDEESLENLLVETNAAAACVKSLLEALLSGEARLPEIRYFSADIDPARHQSPEDMEKKVLRQKLGRAAMNLQQKRQRRH